jgi:hypothetical protein
LNCASCSAISSRYNLSPSGGSCQSIDHVDITKISNISITNFLAKNTASLTVGFWSFKETTVDEDKLIEINIGPHLLIGIANTKQGALYCIPNIRDFSYLSTASTGVTSNLDTAITNAPKAATAKATFGADMIKKWIYYRCAYSYENKELYSYVRYTGAPIVTTSTTKPEVFFNMDIIGRFDTLYRDNDTYTITFKYANTLGASVFIKNFMVFSDYIISKSRYEYL